MPKQVSAAKVGTAYFDVHPSGGENTIADGRKAVTGLAASIAGVPAAKARSTVAGRLGRQPRSAELVIVPGATAKLVWMTMTPTGRGTYRSLVDAGSGAVLKEENTVRRADGVGQVFDPNPVVRLQNE